MVEEREFEAESESAAVALAAKELGVVEADIDYTVLDEGAEGMFGLGGRPARIRVRPASSEPEDEIAGEAEPEPLDIDAKVEQTREALGKVLEYMNVDAEVLVDAEPERLVARVEDKEGSLEAAKLFDGARPPLAPALQFLLNKMVNRFPTNRMHIVLVGPGAEVPKVAATRTDGPFDPELVSLAEHLGQRVKESGRILTIHPMLAGERKAIHQSLVQTDGVDTVSSGEGLYRKLHILPASSGRGGRGDRSGRGRSRRR